MLSRHALYLLISLLKFSLFLVHFDLASSRHYRTRLGLQIRCLRKILERPQTVLWQERRGQYAGNENRSDPGDYYRQREVRAAHMSPPTAARVKKNRRT